MAASADPRIDLLLYAHDGRGLGHASRAVAVGSAVRRLFPKLRILFLSGCRQSATLIGPIPLDWIKLPAYEKIVVNGASEARIGPTNLKNSYLVKSRARLIRAIVKEYRPRCVLVDHEARGKRSELLPAIRSALDTIWILGLRGIVGQVEDVWSPQTARIFRRHYRALLWYGDAVVLGDGPLRRIKAAYGIEPYATGYISRFKEMLYWGKPAGDRAPRHAGVVAVSWDSAAATAFLHRLKQALAVLGPQYGQWRIFTSGGRDIFKDLSYCRVEELGSGYLYALKDSKSAVVYGGYNSITDVLSAGVPALVLHRDLADREQEEHLGRLAVSGRTAIRVMSESDASAERLRVALDELLHAARPQDSRLNLDGAENAARKIAAYLTDGSVVL